MSIIPIVLAMFGVAAVAGGGSSGKKKNGRLIRADLVQEKELPIEKFIDGRFYCYKGPGSYYKPDNGWGSEYAYLGDVRNDATSRVQAMRAKISAGGKRSTRTLKPIIEGSEIALFTVANEIYNASRTTSGRMALANKLGVPVTSLNNAINKISDTVAKYAGPAASSYIRELVDFSGEYVAKLIRDLAQKMVSEAMGTAAAAGVAEAIPIIGQAFALYLKLASASHEIKNEQFRAGCEGWNSEFRTALNDITKYGFPLPFHLLDTWSPECRGVPGSALAPSAERWTPTEAQTSIMTALASLKAQWMALNVGERSNVIRWWSVAMTFMSDPRVSTVFANLGHDGLGGTIASDEQVMLVAAPVAVAYGLDVDSLARELWRNARTWGVRDANYNNTGKPIEGMRPDDSPQVKATISTPVYTCKKGFWASGCDITGAQILCKDYVTNSYALNFAELCKVVFPLAEKMRASGVGLAKKDTVKTINMDALGLINPVVFSKS